MKKTIDSILVMEEDEIKNKYFTQKSNTMIYNKKQICNDRKIHSEVKKKNNRFPNYNLLPQTEKPNKYRIKRRFSMINCFNQSESGNYYNEYNQNLITKELSNVDTNELLDRIMMEFTTDPTVYVQTQNDITPIQNNYNTININVYNMVENTDQHSYTGLDSTDVQPDFHDYHRAKKRFKYY